MSDHKERTVGILGGMGPEATIDLMQRIIRLTPALDDADHIRCIVDNNPKVPSRIKAIIEGDGEDPGPCMADMGRRLGAWGADFLAIACNTAHYYYDAVRASRRYPGNKPDRSGGQPCQGSIPGVGQSRHPGLPGRCHDRALHQAVPSTWESRISGPTRTIRNASFKRYQSRQKRQHRCQRPRRLSNGV